MQPVRVLHEKSTYSTAVISGSIEVGLIVAELSSCWRKAFRKIFGLPPWSSVNQILLFTSVLPLEYGIDQRRLNFMTNLQSLPNERVVMISQICRNSDYRDLYIKYNVDVECSKSKIKSAVADCFANNMTV